MKTNRSTAKRLIVVLLTVLIMLSAFAAVCIYYDPFCHYHAPGVGYSYITSNPFYLNDGIIRRYDFNGVLTGSSMTENFKASEAEELFGGKFVKIPLSASSFPETTDQLKRAYSRGKNLQNVIRSLDHYAVFMGKDETMHDLSGFDYIYNDLWLDDVKYLLNLEVFCKYTIGLLDSRLPADEPAIDFDTYCSWELPTGKEAVLGEYPADCTPAAEETLFTPEDREKVIENIRCNITDIAYEHPETTFFCFFPPYSICNWDIIKNVDRTFYHDIEALKIAAEEILKCPNIRLFGFDDRFDITCDLDNYKDPLHYNSAINSMILKNMSEDVSRLTPENYLDYFDRIERFYSGYDYAKLHG